MDILKIALIAIITAFCYLCIKDVKSEMATMIALCGGIVILLSIVDSISNIFSQLEKLLLSLKLGGDIIKLVVKIVGISLVVDFSAGICEECGTKSLSDKIVFAGKVSLIICSLPMIIALIQLIVGMLK